MVLTNASGNEIVCFFFFFMLNKLCPLARLVLT